MRDIFLCQVGVCASESEGTGSGALSTGKNTAPELGREGLRLLSLAVGSCCECRGVVLNQALLLGWVWDGLGCSAGAWAGPGLCHCGLKPILQGPPLRRPCSWFSCLLPPKHCNNSGKLPGQQRRLEILHLPALISFLP